jgi:hypothetical protein
MNNLVKFITFAAVGVAIGTVASKFVKPEKSAMQKKLQPAVKGDQLTAKEDKRSGNKDREDLDDCFI